MAKNIIIFLGAPGSGKGSISELCIKELNFKQFSTGDMCRKHIKEGTEIGKQIDFAIKNGKLVSDSLIIKMVENWLENEVDKDGCHIILDGCPRTIEQADKLIKILENKYCFLKLRVFRLFVSDEEVINRIVNRWICKNCQAVYSKLENSPLAPKEKGVCDKCNSQLICRKDDTLDAVNERLRIYHKHEQSLIDFFKKINYEINEIDASKEIKEVFKSFEGMIKNDLH